MMDGQTPADTSKRKSYGASADPKKNRYGNLLLK